MAKLTDMQKRRIAAEYVAGDGNISQRTLAVKYHVSQKTVSKILSDANITKKVSEKKAENTLSMLAYLDSRKDAAQALIDQILVATPGDIDKASLRDKMGALKILSDTFCKPVDSVSAAEEKRHITVEFVESAKDEH